MTIFIFNKHLLQDYYFLTVDYTLSKMDVSLCTQAHKEKSFVGLYIKNSSSKAAWTKKITLLQFNEFFLFCFFYSYTIVSHCERSELWIDQKNLVHVNNKFWIYRISSCSFPLEYFPPMNSFHSKKSVYKVKNWNIVTTNLNLFPNSKKNSFHNEEIRYFLFGFQSYQST